MTRAQVRRARERVRHYDTPARILAELHRIGSRYLWPAIGRATDPHSVGHRVRLGDARDAWREHESLARRQLLQDGYASAALWDVGRAILVRAALIAREARRP